MGVLCFRVNGVGILTVTTPKPDARVRRSIDRGFGFRAFRLRVFGLGFLSQGFSSPAQFLHCARHPGHLSAKPSPLLRELLLNP